MSRRITFRVAALRSAVLIAFAALTPIIPSNAAFAAPCWQPPVTGRVTDPFRPPSCPYCAGNRGLHYRVGPNAQVRAVAAGVVSWAGSIADVTYVVVRHANGWRTTYGRLTSTSLRTGDPVTQRSSVGTASGAFHFGLRVGEEYRDPAPHLGRLVGRPRLIPVDGSAARPAPAPRWRCGTAS